VAVASWRQRQCKSLVSHGAQLPASRPRGDGQQFAGQFGVDDWRGISGKLLGEPGKRFQAAQPVKAVWRRAGARSRRPADRSLGTGGR
jgi:hypothetical protein